jgi:hypothetical protein
VEAVGGQDGSLKRNGVDPAPARKAGARFQLKASQMDHKEQHHQKHEHEREHEKKEHKAHERQEEKSLLPFHPAWLVVLGIVLTLAAVLVWTFIL